MEISDRIRAARAQKGWGQRRLAQRMKVSPSAVAQWELGMTRPSIAHRGKLADILGVSLSDLLPEVRPVAVERTEFQFGFRGKRQLWLFAIWKEFWEDERLVSAVPKFVWYPRWLQRHDRTSGRAGDLKRAVTEGDITL